MSYYSSLLNILFSSLCLSLSPSPPSLYRCYHPYQTVWMIKVYISVTLLATSVHMDTLRKLSGSHTHTHTHTHAHAHTHTHMHTHTCTHTHTHSHSHSHTHIHTHTHTHTHRTGKQWNFYVMKVISIPPLMMTTSSLQMPSN